MFIRYCYPALLLIFSMQSFATPAVLPSDASIAQQFQSPDAFKQAREARPENSLPLSAAGNITQLSRNGSTLYIIESGRVANLIISSSLYQAMADGTVSSAQLAGLSKTIYDFYEDRFDFILFSNSQPELTAGYYGKHFSVQNDIRGIGTSIYDNTAYWGSNESGGIGGGKLQGVIHFPYIDGLVNGPGLHELTHRWANHITEAFPSSVGGHWGFSSIGGQLGGWAEGTLTSLGNNQYQANKGSGASWFGTFANGGNSLPYANMELYLMGMIPAAQLLDIEYAGNPVWVDRNNGIFSADTMNQVSAQSIITTLGARLPAFQSSQKSFNVLNVIVSTARITAQQFAANDVQITAFSLRGDNGSYLYNFWEATGGVGQLNMSLGISALKAAPVEQDDDWLLRLIPAIIPADRDTE